MRNLYRPCAALLLPAFLVLVSCGGGGDSPPATQREEFLAIANRAQERAVSLAATTPCTSESGCGLLKFARPCGWEYTPVALDVPTSAEALLAAKTQRQAHAAAMAAPGEPTGCGATIEPSARIVANPPRAPLSAEELRAIDEYVEDYWRGVVVLARTTDAYGKHVDCVDINRQPGLRRPDGTFAPLGSPSEELIAGFGGHLAPPAISTICPPGSAEYRDAPSRETIIEHGGLDGYLHAPHGVDYTPPESVECLPTPSLPDASPAACAPLGAVVPLPASMLAV